MVHLNKELRAFADMLGKRHSKIEAGTVASGEVDDIAEFRLAQVLGKDVDDPEFRATWNAVQKRSYEAMDSASDDGIDHDGLTVPADHELDGLPDRCWTFTVLGVDEQVIRHVAVFARTNGEAMRLVEAASIPGAHGLTLPIRATVLHREARP